MRDAQGRHAPARLVARPRGAHLLHRTATCAVFAQSVSVIMSVRVAHAPFGAETVFRLVTAVEQALDALRSASAAARVRDELARLSPRERADIGIEDPGLPEAGFDSTTRALLARTFV